MNIIDVTDFGAVPGGMDVTLPVWRAIQACRGRGPITLNFPKGDWHFRPACAQERLLAISNNSHGLKRVALPLFDHEGLAVEGNGSRFLMHGKIIPLVVSGSRGVALKDFSVDWVDPFIGQGRVIRSDGSGFDLEMSPAGAAWRVKDGTLRFTGEGWEDPFDYFLEFDGNTGFVAGKVLDNGGSGWHRTYAVDDLGGGNIRVHAETRTVPVVGNTLLMKGGNRHSPGIFMEASDRLTFEKVRVYHAGGMAFIGQKCEAVTLSGCRVEPTPGSGRIFSSKADATHFVNCRGHLLLEDGHFEGQLDDPGNFHGIYGRIDERLAGGDLLVRLVHHEQVGVPLYAPGERVRFIDPETLLPRGEAVVKSVDVLNVDRMVVSVDAVPPGIRPGSCLENLEWVADVTIRNCVTRRNRARGFLLSTAGKIRVEGNVFENPGSALKISGDSNSWFESGAVCDVRITGNTFRHCNHGVWGKACIDIDPEISNTGAGYYHRGIRIEGNRFETAEPRLVFARSVSGISFNANHVHDPSGAVKSFRITAGNCEGVVVSGNKVEGNITQDD